MRTQSRLKTWTALPLICTLLFGAAYAISAPAARPKPKASDDKRAEALSSASDLLNIAIRARVLKGDHVLIGGFIVTGSGSKRVIIRALGPSLTAAGIQEALEDPTLELYNSAGEVIARNDNWQESQASEIEATTIPPGDPREAAIVVTLPGGGASYTAVVRGKNETTGVGLVEVYDLDTLTPTKLGNLSARGLVQTGENVMIGGIIVGGGGGEAARVVARAIGPSLTALGVPDALADPTLELRNANGALVAYNDNWQDGQRSELESALLAPIHPLEAATVTMLNAGLYTSVVRGRADTTGVAVVEAYRLDNSGNDGGDDDDDLLPPDPTSIAPPVEPGVGGDIGTAVEFLFTGPNPVQTGVAPGTIDKSRVAVLKGRVFRRDGTALSGVKISVLSHPEFGQTLSRMDGAFDLAVNGGSQLTVRYEKNGFPSAQRTLFVPWRDYASLPDVVLVPFDPLVTTIDLSAATMQVARGSTVTDQDGVRQATVMVPQGTSAEMVLPDGSRQALGILRMRATEYTVGSSGPKAMPAALPPSSGYTYAVELSVDEAVAVDATEVRFNQALPTYVENFLGFPVGTAVPSGYYDRQKGQWVASANGRVIKVLGLANNQANLDVDGDDIADDGVKLIALGVTNDERSRLAQLYSAGQTLWRVPLTHFTPCDFNWPYGPPSDGTPPPGQKQSGPPVDDENQQCGSVIGCENQTLGESLPLTGTPWRLHYTSKRTPGRKDAYTLTIPLSGETVPASLRQVRVEVDVAGRQYRQTFTPSPNLSYSIVWDGKDGYGRLVQGVQEATVQVHFDYAPQYYAVPSDFVNSFARAEAAGTAVTASRASSTIALSKKWVEPVGAWDARAAGFGGWSLSVQHAYDPTARMLLLGNGRQRSADARSMNVITTVAGNGNAGFTGDGGPATAANVGAPNGIAVGADGSLFIAAPSFHRIRRVGPDGIITTVAGNGSAGFSGDGGPATAARLNVPTAVAVGGDGSLYIADDVNKRIRRVGPDGIITTVAGNGTAGFSGDGGPATAARLGSVQGVAVGPDGSLYLADISLTTARIRRIGPDGIITTVAGDGAVGFSGDGGPATAARLNAPRRVAVGPDGSLFIADNGNRRIRRVSPDGMIATVAGTDGPAFSGDGGPATSATLSDPYGLAVGPDGSLYIADQGNNRIRVVSADGIITTVAGNGSSVPFANGGPATAARLGAPYGVALGPDGSLFIADQGFSRVRRVQSALPGFSFSEILLPSEDGREIFVFSSSGRHLRTVDGLSGAVRLQFGYNAGGQLITITDGSGNITNIERAGAQPSAVVAPGGQRTALTARADGWLLSATNPANEVHAMSHSAGGLLQSFTDPRGNIHLYTYDAAGRLLKDENPAGGSTTLNRTEQDNSYTVITTSALGRTRTYKAEQLSDGAVRRTVIQPDGTTTTMVIGTDGSEQTTYANGTIGTVQYGPDPRWGMLAPVAAKIVIASPGGLTRTISTTRTVTLSDPANVLSLTKLTDTFNDNGAVSTRTYDGPTRLFTLKSATGRTETVRIDALGRVTQAQAAGLQAIDYEYDSRGRLSAIRGGSGAQARVFSLTYNAQNQLVGVQDPLSRTLALEYDLAGRLTAETQPDTGAVDYSYDANGNPISVSPPGKPMHGFSYLPGDRLSSYTPPDIGIGNTATEYADDKDGRIVRMTRPDGLVVQLTYDGAGRRSTLALSRGLIGYTYDAAGRRAGVNAPGGLDLSYTYDGHVLTGRSANGPVSGSVSGAFDPKFRLASLSVNGTNPLSFVYDADNLLTQAGALTLSRNAQNGLLTNTTLGVVTDARTYNSFAERLIYTASTSGALQFRVQYTRDALGRITGKSETLGAVTDTYVYTYDAGGRLTGVQKNGATSETYTYDLNGNRLSATLSGVSNSANYDAQDRLLQSGSTTFSYTAAGELAAKTTGGQTTTYSYDEAGNLLAAALPGGPAITYLVDGTNRRVGKRINGTLVQAFLYQNHLRPEAELDGAGAIVSRFVYATSVNVPAYLVKGGVTYRIVTDHLGSPRLVINTSSGAVVQRMDYDSFGKVLLDTNPGFQPFGFAGGLYDHHTGLVRFGVRDYDPAVGRWTAKDPILFGGGQANLYAYVANDPINFYDPTGLLGWPSLDDIKGWFVDKAVETALDKAADSTELTKTGKEIYDAAEKALEFAEDARDLREACNSGDPARGFDALKQWLEWTPNLPEPVADFFTGAIDTVQNSDAREALGRLGRSENGSGTSNANVENQLRQLQPGLAP